MYIPPATQRTPLERPGTVLKFVLISITEGLFRIGEYLHHDSIEPIVEVLWSNNEPGWILKARLEVVCGK